MREPGFEHPHASDPGDVEVVRLQTQLSSALEELKQTRSELEAIQNSTIWRMSLAVRAPVMFILRLRHGWGGLPGRIARHGGWFGHFCEWWRDIQSYGWGYFGRVATYEHNPGPGSGDHDRNDYTAWKHRFTQTKPAASIPTDPSPLMSVVLPVYRPPLHLLQEAVASVLRQRYTNWELCIADDASNDEQLTAYLHTLESQHANVHVIFRKTNGHISQCTNSALDLATGEFVVLLDQDDLLPEEALAEVVKCVAEHPDVGIIFSDEDRIVESGTRSLGAYFKPDFNYDLFMGHNMVSHLGVYRRSLLTAIGGFRRGVEGSQDYDVALRALERLRLDQVVHIPKVLYHWRAIQGSTALSQSEKTYTTTASYKALVDHLERTGVAAEVLPCRLLPNFHRIRYTLASNMQRATVVLAFDYPVHQVRELITMLGTRAGVRDTSFIWVTSQAVTAADIQTDPQSIAPTIQVVSAPPGGSALARVATALPLSDDPILAVLTMPFSEATDGWLDELARFAAQPRVGFVAPMVVDAADQIKLVDHGGILFTDNFRAVHAHKGLHIDHTGYAGRGALSQSFSALSPALLVVRRELINTALPLTSLFGDPLDFVDLCLEFRDRGLANVWTPEVELRFNDLRFAGRTNLFTSLPPLSARRTTWIQKWGPKPKDPAYNPNLSLDGDFSLNWRV